MKAFVVTKMIFIFLCLTLAIVYFVSEVSDSCWVSFIRGAGFTCFTLALIKNIADIIREKPDGT